MVHLVLVGDSVFDNGAYVGDGPAVIDQMRAQLPRGSRVTLSAVDGSRLADARDQLSRLPRDATHVAISAGGNDLLARVDVLQHRVDTVGAALVALEAIRADYEIELHHLAEQAVRLGVPTVLCSVYEPRFPDGTARRAARAALRVFGDALVRVARRARLPVLDLRAVCHLDDHFANPIEPSSAGGDAIVQALWRVFHEHDFRHPRTAIYP